MLRFWKIALFFLCSSFLLTSLRADMDLLSKLYLSDKKYAKNIEVQTYIVTKEQVAQLFSEQVDQIIQKSNKELYGKEIFLLIRCRNFGDYRSFGIVDCKIGNRKNSISIDIPMMPGYMNSFYNAVLPLYSGSVPNDNEVPTVSYEWKSLYTI